MGYKDVSVYREGILGWVKAGYQLDSAVKYPKVKIERITSAELNNLDNSSFVLLDIRPPSHFQRGHIKNSINIDLEKLHTKLDMLPKDRKICLIDHKGKLTLTTGRYLFLNGFTNISRLDGGFNAWVKNGFPADNSLLTDK